jgi:uncharacterized membrane protein YedE/YeeE
MNLDWNSFTPESALAGGVILGLASALFILINGRILGISGIIGGLFRPRAGDIAWRIAFLLGLLSSPIIFGLWTTLPDARVDADWPTVGIAGLLVGIGTRYGAGCTSGHGVCGLSRLSPRSMIATLSFMAAGFLTVYALRHLAGAS